VVIVERKRWAYSKPAADGSFRSATVEKPAARNASSVRKRWALDEFAGTETAASSGSSGSTPAFERVTRSSLICRRKPARRSRRRTGRPPTSTSARGPASARSRLNDRTRRTPGSCRTAAASNP